MSFMRPSLDPVSFYLVSRVEVRLWDTPDEKYSKDEKLFMAIWPTFQFGGNEGIERMIEECRERSLDENRDCWAEIEEGLDYFELRRFSFLKKGMDWILSQSERRRAVMIRLITSKYMEVRVFRKLVKVGLIDLASIDLKAIHDELIRRGLMDDPNV